LVSAILTSTLLITACEKDGDGNYVKATINGNSWKTNSVSVETMGTGSGAEPWKITGSLNGEEISIRLTGQNPGNYPFRIDGTNPAILLSFTGELFESSLAFSGAVLRDLGFSDIEVAETIEEVRERDEARFEAQLAGGIEAGRSLWRNNTQTPQPTPFTVPRREAQALNEEAADLIEEEEEKA
jgi:hypothetical protein